MGNIRIVYKGFDTNYHKPTIGERYIIHKPIDLDESPSWVWYMDIYDGYIVEIIREFHDSANKIDKIGWIADPVDYEYEDIDYYFNINWLEKIDNFGDLNESDVNFFDI